MAKRSGRVKKSAGRKQRLGKKKPSKTKRHGKRYSKKRFYKRSKRLMRGG